MNRISTPRFLDTIRVLDDVERNYFDPIHRTYVLAPFSGTAQTLFVLAFAVEAAATTAFLSLSSVVPLMPAEAKTRIIRWRDDSWSLTLIVIDRLARSIITCIPLVGPWIAFSVKQLVAELASTHTARERISQDAKTLQQRLNASEQAVESYKQQVHSLQEDNLADQREFIEKANDFEATRKGWIEKGDQLMASCTEAVNAKEKVAENLRTALGEARARIAELEGLNVQKMAEENAQLQTTVHSLNDKVSSLSKELSQLTVREQEYKVLVEGYTLSLDQQKKEAHTLETTQTVLRRTVEELEQTLTRERSENKSALADSRATIQSLKATVNQHETEKGSLNHEIDSLRRQNLELLSQLTKHKKELASSTEALQREQKERFALRTRVEELSTQTAKLQALRNPSAIKHTTAATKNHIVSSQRAPDSKKPRSPDHTNSPTHQPISPRRRPQSPDRAAGTSTSKDPNG